MTKNMDASGGSLTSPDGKLNLVIPAGALSHLIKFDHQCNYTNCPVETDGGCDAGKATYDTPNFLINGKPQTSFTGDADHAYTKFTLTPK